MKKVKILACIVMGLLVGVLGGGVSLKGGLGSGSAKAAKIEINQWASDWSIGSPAASARLRAGVALRGLLALAKSEAVYFTAAVDDDGRPLSSRCIYELSGTGQQATWWSVTLYDGDSRLPMNTDGALSFDATQAGGKPWTVMISAKTPESGPWISSNAAGTFDLTLRLYEPSSRVLNTPEITVNAPKIKRRACDVEAAS